MHEKKNLNLKYIYSKSLNIILRCIVLFDNLSCTYVKMTCLLWNRFKNNSSVAYADEREKMQFWKILMALGSISGEEKSDQSCCQASFGHESDGNFLYRIRVTLSFSLSYDWSIEHVNSSLKVTTYKIFPEYMSEANENVYCWGNSNQSFNKAVVFLRWSSFQTRNCKNWVCRMLTAAK